MRGNMRKYALAILLLLPTAGSAQEIGSNPAWTFAVTLYGWAPALTTDVDTRFGDVKSRLSRSDLISDLDFAFMGTFEARRGEWALIGDLVYSDISEDAPTPLGELFRKAKVSTELSLFSGYAAYRAYESDRGAIDIAGGFRVISLDVDVKLIARRARENRSQSLSKTWVQPVVGVRGILPLNESWSLRGFADIGGTGSKEYSWQVYASLDYSFNARWSALLGYRYMEIREPISGRDTRLRLDGPVLGVTYRF